MYILILTLIKIELFILSSPKLLIQLMEGLFDYSH